MKKIVPNFFLACGLAFLFILLQSCNQNTKEQEQTAEHVHDHDHDHDHEGDAPDMLTLNNGSKWQADEPTNKNAAVLISIGEAFKTDTDKTLEDYQTFGSDINDAINVMIQECSMEGEADAALHNWFLPVLKQAGTLENATDTTGLSEIALGMVHRLNEYHDYFE